MTTISTTDPSIFISYRRDDSAGHAGRLADRLTQRLGPDRVFRDIEDIAAGEDFVTRLERQVDECQVLLALIGPRWLAPGPSGRPRLFDEQDWVRREIVRSMSRGMRVIPVLLQGATMPGPDALPPDLAPLARLNALELREAQFERDADHLVNLLAPTGLRSRLRRMAMAAALLLLVAAGGYAAFWMWDQTPGRAQHRLEQAGIAFDDATFVARAAQGDADTVRLFLRAGQDVEAKDAEQHTALWRAVEAGHADIVRLLLEADATSEIELAISNHGASDEIFDLLMAQAPRREALNRALATAAATGQIARMERLVAAGADLDADQRAPARNAAFNAQPTVLRWLIDQGAAIDGSFDDGGETLLHVASGASIPVGAEGNPIIEMATLLLDQGADPNAVRGPGSGMLSTALLMAANSDRTELAKLLLDRGAKPDLASSDASARTPLMVAAERDNVDIARLLLTHGAQIDTPDSNGMTALMVAAHRGRLETLDLLIEHDANVNRQTPNGVTALMLAVDNLDPKVVARLLAAEADVDARTAAGATALTRLEARSIPRESPAGENAAAVAALLASNEG